ERAREEPAEGAAPASAASCRGAARPREIAGEEMRRRSGVERGARGRLLCEIGREAFVEKQHRHVDDGAQRGSELLGRARLLATACLPASSAARAPCGFLPPASASVGLPPPPPPMCFPSSRTSCDASSPCDTSDSSKLITRNARPSSLDTTIAPAAFSSWRSRS